MLKDLLRVHDTGRVYPGYWSTITAVNEGESIPAASFQDRTEYVLDLTVCCSFVANSTEFERAKREATRLLVHRLYDDIIGDIREATVSCTDPETHHILARVLSKINS